MRCMGLLSAAAVLVCGCTTVSPDDPLEHYEELDSTGVIDAAAPEPGIYSAHERDMMDAGEYLVELLGCGACHTNGAFDGAPDMSRPLSGSDTGIAWTNPLKSNRPGVVYPPNITPDEESGIGRWSDLQIVNAIRDGSGQHGVRRITPMPWQGYTKISDDDVDAIVAYLRSIKPIQHEVPAPVNMGENAHNPYVYFGVYRSKL